MKIKPELKKPFDEGRLLILSPFQAKYSRISADRSESRNHFVAAISHSVFIPYAAENSKTAELVRLIEGWGKPLYTAQSMSNLIMRMLVL
jgi:hypothetical protein